MHASWQPAGIELLAYWKSLYDTAVFDFIHVRTLAFVKM